MGGPDWLALVRNKDLLSCPYTSTGTPGAGRSGSPLRWEVGASIIRDAEAGLRVLEELGSYPSVYFASSNCKPGLRLTQSVTKDSLTELTS